VTLNFKRVVFSRAIRIGIYIPYNHDGNILLRKAGWAIGVYLKSLLSRYILVCCYKKKKLKEDELHHNVVEDAVKSLISLARFSRQDCNDMAISLETR